jgi:hypothetical protein
VAIPGSLWVDGAYLYHIDANGYKWRTTGKSVGLKSTAKPGSIWVEGDSLCYIDANKYKRKCPRTLIGAKTGIAGSAWVEGSYVHFLDSTKRKTRVWKNWSDWDDWDDSTPHTDIPHYDYEADVHRYWEDYPYEKVPKYTDHDVWSDHDDNPVKV